MRGEKYLQLQQFLKTNGSVCITLSFENIEQVLGFKLPNSAYKHSAWWSNSIGKVSLFRKTELNLVSVSNF